MPSGVWSHIVAIIVLSRSRVLLLAKSVKEHSQWVNVVCVLRLPALCSLVLGLVSSLHCLFMCVILMNLCIVGYFDWEECDILVFSTINHVIFITEWYEVSDQATVCFVVKGAYATQTNTYWSLFNIQHERRDDTPQKVLRWRVKTYAFTHSYVHTRMHQYLASAV